jgi:hypothetical protein
MFRCPGLPGLSWPICDNLAARRLRCSHPAPSACRRARSMAKQFEEMDLFASNSHLEEANGAATTTSPPISIKREPDEDLEQTAVTKRVRFALPVAPVDEEDVVQLCGINGCRPRSEPTPHAPRPSPHAHAPRPTTHATAPDMQHRTRPTTRRPSPANRPPPTHRSNTRAPIAHSSTVPPPPPAARLQVPAALEPHRALQRAEPPQPHAARPQRGEAACGSLLL